MRRALVPVVLCSLACGGVWSSARTETLVDGANEIQAEIDSKFPPGPEHDALSAVARQYKKDAPTGRIGVVQAGMFEATFKDIVEDGKYEDHERIRLMTEYDGLVRGPKGKLPGNRTELIEP